MSYTPSEVLVEEYAHFSKLLGGYWAVQRLAQAYGMTTRGVCESLRRSGVDVPFVKEAAW